MLVYIFIFILISVVLIAMALFSKRVRRLSEAIEYKKKKNSLWYAKQRDVFKFYCPQCNQQLPSDSIVKLRKLNRKTIIVCPNCNVQLCRNILQQSLFLCGIVASVSFLIFNKLHPLSVTMEYLWMFCSFGLIMASFLLEKLRIFMNAK